jgi:hypothetical protein
MLAGVPANRRKFKFEFAYNQKITRNSAHQLLCATFGDTPATSYSSCLTKLPCW